MSAAAALEKIAKAAYAHSYGKRLLELVSDLEQSQAAKAAHEQQALVMDCHGCTTAQAAIHAMRTLRYELAMRLPLVMAGLCDGRPCGGRCVIHRPTWSRNPITDWDVDHWPDGEVIVPRFGTPPRDAYIPWADGDLDGHLCL